MAAISELAFEVLRKLQSSRIAEEFAVQPTPRRQRPVETPDYRAVHPKQLGHEGKEVASNGSTHRKHIRKGIDVAKPKVFLPSDAEVIYHIANPRRIT